MWLISFPRVCLLSLFFISSLSYGEDITREEIRHQHESLEQSKKNVPEIDDSREVAKETTERAQSASSDNPDLVSQLLDRVTALEARVRQLQGEIETINNQTENAQAKLAKETDDLRFSLQTLKESTARSPEKYKRHGLDMVHSSPYSNQKNLRSVNAYDQLISVGRQAVKAQNYTISLAKGLQAIKAAKTVNDKSAATYLVGQSYAGQGDYRNAAVSYYDAYKVAPKSSYAAQSLIGVAATMVAMENKTAACQALDKLEDEFSPLSLSLKASYKKYRRSAGCL